MDARRLCAAATILLCLFVCAESSGKKFMTKDEAMNAILKVRQQIMKSEDDTADFTADGLSSAGLEEEAIREILKTAKEMFQNLSTSDQDRITNGAKTLGIFLETAYQALQTNGHTKGCNTCMTVTRFLKVATIFYTSDEIMNVVYNVCVNYIPKLYPPMNYTIPDQPEIFCNIVYLQGPHVYAVFKHLDITTLVQCEYLNYCLPSPSNDTALETGGRTMPPFIHNRLPTLPAGSTIHRPIFPLPTKPHATLPPGTLPTGTLPTVNVPTGSFIPDGRRKRGAPTSHPEVAGSRRKRSLENALRVAFLTDVHVDLFYEAGTLADCGMPVCCNADDGNGTAPPWGDYYCSLPYRTLELFLNKTKSLNPDLMLYGGDNPPAKVWSGTEWGHFNCTKALINAITQILPGLPTYPNLGNHEAFPTNLYYTGLNATQELNLLFPEWWSPLANFSAENMDTMHDWFYFAKEVKPGLVLLSFNSLYMYTLNFYISLENSVLLEKNSHVMRMQAYMVQTMETAMAKGQKVILMGHVPAGNGATMPGRWLTNFVLKYSQVIVLYVAGHTHQDDFRLVIHPNTNEPMAVNLVAPSVDPRNFRNPAMRMFYLDPVTFEALDYDQYYMDIATSIGSGKPEIQFSYQATVEYGMPDLSPASYLELAIRMNNDPVLFQTFVTNYFTHVTTNEDSVHTCTTPVCRNQWLCRVTNSNYDEREACVTNQYFLEPPTTAPPPCVGTGGGAVWRVDRVAMAALVALSCLRSLL